MKTRKNGYVTVSDGTSGLGTTSDRVIEEKRRSQPCEDSGIDELKQRAHHIQANALKWE